MQTVYHVQRNSRDKDDKDGITHNTHLGLVHSEFRIIFWHTSPFKWPPNSGIPKQHSSNTQSSSRSGVPAPSVSSTRDVIPEGDVTTLLVLSPLSLGNTALRAVAFGLSLPAADSIAMSDCLLSRWPVILGVSCCNRSSSDCRIWAAAALQIPFCGDVTLADDGGCELDTPGCPFSQTTTGKLEIGND